MNGCSPGGDTGDIAQGRDDSRLHFSDDSSEEGNTNNGHGHRDAWGPQQSMRMMRHPAPSHNDMSGELSALSVDMSAEEPIPRGNATMFLIMEQQLKQCIPNEHVLLVLKLCFSSLAVVFQETSLPKNPTGSPFRYTRIPSIPATAARMLWSELLGGVECQCGQDGYYVMEMPDTLKHRWDPCLTADMIEAIVHHVNGTDDSKFNKKKGWDILFSKYSPKPKEVVRRLSLGSPGDAITATTTPQPKGTHMSWFGVTSKLSTRDHKLEGSLHGVATVDPTERPRGKDPFLYFVRDHLVESGLLEVAGRRVDDEDDDDDEELTSDEEEAEDQCVDDDGGDDDELAIDFSGWQKRKRRNKARRTQYLQIYKDMQHQYGLYLSALPIIDGGLVPVEVHCGDAVNSEGDTFASRGFDTMKRWNDAMANACQKKLKSASVFECESTADQRTKNHITTLWADHLTHSTEKELKESSSGHCEELKGLPKEIATVEPWMKSKKQNPFCDGSTYALRMYPSHLMRSGRVVEAARLLISPRLFLARLCAFGACDAAHRHRANLDELKARSDMAMQGRYDLGGDGDCIHADDIAFAAIHVMISTLDERYPIVSNGDNGNSRKVSGERERGDVGRAFHLIASIFAEKGDTKHAMERYEKALEFKTVSLGPTHVSIARTYRHMGHQHLNQSEYDESIKCYSEALRLEREQDVVDHMKVILALNSIGMIYGMSNRYDKAVDNYCQSLVIQKVHLGEEHPQVAETLNSLGIVYGMMGNFEKAVDCYMDAVAVKIRALGTDHEDVADIYFNLGLVHYKRGEHLAAITAYQEALRIRKTLLGDDHEEVARVLYHIGVVLGDMGEFGEAVRFYEESLRARRLVLGESHEDVARTLHNLGLVYYESGNYDRSLECFEDSLRLTREKVGSKSDKVADILHSMGLIYQNTANYADAIKCYSEAVEIRRAKLGNDHLEVASTQHNIGDVYYMMGELESAMEAYQDAYRIRVQKLGDDDVDMAATRNNMGVVHMKRNEHESAMECFTAALAVRERKLGPDHEKCSDTLHNMGLVYKSLKQYDEAIERYQQALRVRRLQLGENDMKVADTLYNMAIVYANTGQYSSALERYKEALVTYRDTGMTDDHPSVVNTLQWIKWSQKKLSNSNKRDVRYEEGILGE